MYPLKARLLAEKYLSSSGACIFWVMLASLPKSGLTSAEKSLSQEDGITACRSNNRSNPLGQYQTSIWTWVSQTSSGMSFPEWPTVPCAALTKQVLRQLIKLLICFLNLTSQITIASIHKKVLSAVDRAMRCALRKWISWEENRSVTKRRWMTWEHSAALF